MQFDRAAIIRNFFGVICRGCDGKKPPRTGFCSSCTHRLPPRLQEKLCKRFSYGFEEAYQESFNFLSEHK